MADYLPLISRAVAGLEKNTGENRRVLYERARSALVNQLRGVDPPLDESDITRERLALEDAIRKVEAETVKRVRPEMETPYAHPPSARDQGLRDFRETVSEADNLGRAAAQAHRSAREFYESVPGSQRPSVGESGDYDLRSTDRPSYEAPPVSEPDLVDEAPPSPPYPYEPPEGRPRIVHGEREDYARTVRRSSWGRVGKLLVLLLLIGGVAGAGYWQRDKVSTLVATLQSKVTSKPQQAAPPQARPKIADRIGESETAPKSATAPAAAVAQKVVLYDEDPNNPQGKRYVGSAIWRTETVSPGPGLAPELAVRADVEIPERHLRMTWSLRRNTDKALPASHTIEIQFTLPADFDQGGIGNVPGVLMKSGEQERGVPLAGLAVKVTNGYFLIGLSAVDIDKQRNVQMLKERDWLDIPLVYTSSKRAILAIEKGAPGQRAFEDAFRAWGG
jgi:hypothetical protein